MKLFKLNIWRRLSQIFFGVFFTNGYIPVFWTRIIYSGPLKSVCVPFINCHACPTAIFSCPIGMLQHFMAIGQVPYFLIGFIIVFGLIFGRAACGWLCPFGFLQGMMYKIKSKKFSVPKYLFPIKYAVLLILVIILPYFTYEHWFSKLCPYGALIAGIPWVTWQPIDPEFDMAVIDPDSIGIWFIIKIIILVFFLIWFVLAKRPFCKVICPMGAIWSPFNKISLLRFNIKESCPSCGSCANFCSMKLDITEDIDSENCIRCMECNDCKNIDVKFGFKESNNKLNPVKARESETV